MLIFIWVVCRPLSITIAKMQATISKYVTPFSITMQKQAFWASPRSTTMQTYEFNTRISICIIIDPDCEILTLSTVLVLQSPAFPFCLILADGFHETFIFSPALSSSPFNDFQIEAMVNQLEYSCLTIFIESYNIKTYHLHVSGNTKQ